MPYAKYVCPPPAFGIGNGEGEEEYDGEGEIPHKELVELKDDYSVRPVLYRETWWDFFIDARRAAVLDEWACSGLPVLSGTNQDDPARRCYVTPSTGGGCTIPPDLSTLQIADRYIFNALIPVLVERPSGEELLVFVAQVNNRTGPLATSCYNCPWTEPTGPASWMQEGGDEFVIFSTEATLAGARGEAPLVLTDEHTRPDDKWSWQAKAVLWESDRGDDGRMTVFAKRSLLTKFPGSKGFTPMINEIVFQRSDDPRKLSVGAWEKVLWNCQFPCDTEDCSPEEQAACTVPHGYRIRDIALVDETTTLDWDYVGMISWTKTDGSFTSGATPVRIKTRQKVEVKMSVAGDPDGDWVDVGWGGEIDFPFWSGVGGRVATITKVTDLRGQESYELWRIRASDPGGKTPCDAVAGGDDSEYRPNQDLFGDGPKGRFADFIPWNPDPEVASVFTVGCGQPLIYVFDSSSGRDWHIPTDYGAGYTWLLGRLDFKDAGASHTFLYMGTRDNLICNHRSQADYYTGKAIAVSEMTRLYDPPELPNAILIDGFESGSLCAWSAV